MNFTYKDISFGYLFRWYIKRDMTKRNGVHVRSSIHTQQYQGDRSSVGNSLSLGIISHQILIRQCRTAL
jgi:hypothetical protein